MAITRRDAKKRAYDIIKDIERSMKQDVVKLLNSGAIELKNWDDNYKLPKMMLAAILEKEQKNMLPPYPTAKETKEITNMKCYV